MKRIYASLHEKIGPWVNMRISMRIFFPSLSNDIWGERNRNGDANRRVIVSSGTSTLPPNATLRKAAIAVMDGPVLYVPVLSFGKRKFEIRCS